MKRDRSISQQASLAAPPTSPPPTQGMSKRSRVGGRYGNNNNNNNDSDSEGEEDNRRSGSGHGNLRGRSPPRRGYEDYNRGGSGGRYKETPPTSSSTTSRPMNHTPSNSSSSHSYPYKVLCMSKLHPKATDDYVRSELYREFKRYGDISVKVVNEPDERVAYVYFRSAEDAREVKHSKVGIFIYDRAVKVEAAYESAPAQQQQGYKFESDNKRSSAPYQAPPPIQQPPPQQYYRSPPYDSRRDDRYDRYEPRPPPQHHQQHGGPVYRDYNRDPYNRQPQQPYGRYNGPPGGPGAPPHHTHLPPHQMPPHGHLPPRHHPEMHPTTAPPHMIGGPPGTAPPRNFENKKDKFPNYLQHVNPEEDPLATRTLFAGNLEVNITDEELRRIFGRYGIVEDIDIKRPPPGTGNAYAFVRFVNLDMSSRAKSELSGQYIGKFQCKIGYGKMNPTTKIWVGGLGSWTTLPMLEREFDRFGSIKKIDWAKGEIVAYITYETIDAAQAAVKDMRGYPLGGPDKKLRTDFADAGAPVVGENNYGGSGDYEFNNGNNNGNNKRSSKTASPTSDLASPTSDDGSSLSHQPRTISEIASKTPVAWTGGLILKISSFPTKFYLTDGDFEGVENLMRDEDGKFQLKITQRLRLDQSKLDDVTRRLSTSTSHSIFLSLPTTDPLENPTQSRPLRNLVSYLKQKEAAGVISLQSQKDKSTGVLYVFPPCAFSWSLLKRGLPGLVAEETEKQGDHLVVVVIGTQGGV